MTQFPSRDLFWDLRTLLLEYIADPQTRTTTVAATTFGTGDGSDTTFTTDAGNTPVNAVYNVRVAGTEKLSGLDYSVRWGDKSTVSTIIFGTAPAAGDTVVASYQHGATWVHSGEPRRDALFPRIGITHVGSAEEPAALGMSSLSSNIPRLWTSVFQIDIKADSKESFTIGSDKYYGEKLRDYLADLVVNALWNYKNEFYWWKDVKISRVSDNYEVQGIYGKQIDVQITYLQRA